MENKYTEPNASEVGLFGRLALSAKNDMRQEDERLAAKFEAKKIKDATERLQRMKFQDKAAADLAMRLSIEENQAFMSKERERRMLRMAEDKIGEAAARRLTAESESLLQAQEKLNALTEEVARRVDASFKQAKDEEERKKLQDDIDGEEMARRLDLELRDETYAIDLVAEERRAREELDVHRLVAEEKDASLAENAQRYYKDEYEAAVEMERMRAEADRAVADRLQEELLQLETRALEEAHRNDEALAQLLQQGDQKILSLRAEAVAQAWRGVQVCSEDVDEGVGLSFQLPELNCASLVVRPIVVEVLDELGSRRNVNCLSVICDSLLLNALRALNLGTLAEAHRFELELQFDCDGEIELREEDVTWEYVHTSQTLHIVVKNLELRQCSEAKKEELLSGLKSRFGARLQARLARFAGLFRAGPPCK